MRAYKIPGSLESKYHGVGYALAAITGEQVIDIVYLDDINLDFGGSRADALRAINDERIAPTVRYLSSLGAVSVGMCSCWEFVEL